jgi:hypothetical protein
LALAALGATFTEVVLAVPILFLQLLLLLLRPPVVERLVGLTQLRVLLLILAVLAVVVGILVLRQTTHILELVVHQGKVTLVVMAVLTAARSTKAVVVAELLLLAVPVIVTHKRRAAEAQGLLRLTATLILAAEAVRLKMVLLDWVAQEAGVLGRQPVKELMA